MSTELRNLKGTKDYLPDEQRVREDIKRKLTNVFELYSFRPLETPVIAYFDILSSKYAGGSEILKETYQLKDQGDRELALRYDLTVPLCRVIGMNPHMKFPFKRYEIGRVYRDGPVKAGRAREFTQCDVDIVGVKNQTAEAELIALAVQAFTELNIDIIVEVNNRKLLSGILLASGYSEENLSDVILSIDKLKKIERKGVTAELEEKGLSGSNLDKAFSWLEITGSLEDHLENLNSTIDNELVKQGIQELRELFRALEYLTIPREKIRFIPSLARGLEIYTGTVFEVFANSGPVTSSLAAGGRYDKIIGQFLGSKQEYPAVGISFGLVPIYDTVKQKIETIGSRVGVLVISMKSDKTALKLVSDLRKNKIATEFSFRPKIKKALDYANTGNFKWAVIIGKQEVENNEFSLKNLTSGESVKCSFDDLLIKLTD